MPPLFCVGRRQCVLAWLFCCWQLTTDLLPFVQSCANPVIYSFMSHSFRRRVRTGWHHCRRCLRRGDRSGLPDVRNVFHGGGGVEEHRLEEVEADVVAAGHSRRHGSYARRWSSAAAISRNSRRKTGAATHLTVMTGWDIYVCHSAVYR